MLDTPFPPWPSFTDEEADRIKSVLLSNRVNYWTGEECRLFELEFADWVGVNHAIALGNGTQALELALKALQLKPGEEVVVTPRTFLASASAIVAVGAVPVFADIDPDSQNITAETIRPVLTERTRAIICVHLAGWPCDMTPILQLANEHGIWVVEDCAQAHGARYRGQSVGSIGHIGAWSFCQDKIMSTGGEGGMVTTNDPELWARMWSYKDHGKNYEKVRSPHHPPGFRWLHDSFGTNWRMTEIQAAIGRIQLRRMGDWHQRRLQNAKQIWTTASSLKGLRVPDVPDHIEHAAYKCYVFVDTHALPAGVNRDEICAAVNRAGVPCYTGSCSEIYLEKAFDGTGWRPAHRLPVARQLGESALMFLVHPTLEQHHIDKTGQVLTQVMEQTFACTLH